MGKQSPCLDMRNHLCAANAGCAGSWTPAMTRAMARKLYACVCKEREINMTIHIVRLGTPRAPGEGPRLGTVRRPPRGVPKSEFGTRDFYDTWLPNLAPSAELMAQGQAATDDKEWAAFKRKFHAEMKQPDASHVLDLLATLSHHTSFSVGCYCEDEDRCHRSVLRELLAARGAEIG
ncbi:MAG: hypothetical protein K0Q43_2142 [Ramlibacter sp.]|nr:hypothetical protein [Ramlibacter sp.]